MAVVVFCSQFFRVVVVVWLGVRVGGGVAGALDSSE